ncbi:MAG TPA: preprotein translocase subunit SecY [Erysipelothrix sp.]|jgi:preprotein translocase subunit SecY|nr:preprotein translocase subunit SecY [Erysipelothrix sp.]
MIKTYVDLIKHPEIRKKIIFTAIALLVFRLGALITAPNVNEFQLTAGASNSIIDMMNLLGGGMLQSFSIFALGVGPYITASIVFQLLAMDVVPYFTNLQKEGEQGRKTLDRYTRYLAVVLAFVQSISMLYAMNAGNPGLMLDPTVTGYFSTGLVMTAGSMFLLWLGDQISKKGIGNGTSMIIFAGIVSGLPNTFRTVYEQLLGSGFNAGGLINFLLFILLYVLIIILVIFMTNAERRIPIQYTSSALVQRKSDKNYLPLKINSASVIPVIFANAIMTAPVTVLSFLNNDWARGAYVFLSDFFSLSSWTGLAIYSILIIFFTFFYTNLQVDPKKISENLQKNGSYVVSIRPGEATRKYVSTVLNRITVLGSAFLLFIALLPHIIPMVSDVPAQVAVGGTGIIIVVGVALETMKSLTSQMTQRRYTGFKRGN